MKKTYITPAANILSVRLTHMINASGGVTNGSTPGNSYNSEDVDYSRKHHSIWDDDEE